MYNNNIQQIFSIYIRPLIDSLKKSDLGCHVHGVYVGCLVYADDVILLSVSVLHLQKMLDICSDQAADIDIVFNAKKCNLFAVGKLFDNIDNLNLGTDVISWSENLKYMGIGISFIAGKTLTVDFASSLCKFYAAANSICPHTKYTSEITKLFLVESYCLPLISYGCEALKLNSYQMHQLNVCWINAYRGEFFYYNSWESLRTCSIIVVD